MEGKSPAQRLLKARILLKADVSQAGDGWSDSRIMAALETSSSMVYRVRKGGRGLRCGVEPQATRDAGGRADLRRREGSQVDSAGLFQTAQGPRALDLAVVGEQGGGAQDRRACKRLNDRSCFKKTLLKPHRRQCWVIPPKANSAFVAAMEDVLAVYTRPHDPDRPLVCLDETSKQLIAETRLPIPMKPGRPARCDYEYERNGTANLFMLFAPLEGWRCVKVTDRRTAVDYAHGFERLGRYPLLRCPDNRSGPGRSQHPQQSFALRGLPGRRSPAAGRAVRMALHAKTRQLAQSGGAGTRRLASSQRPTAASPISESSVTRSPPGNMTEIKIAPRQIGASQPPTPASNSSTSTRQSD